jgi:hypothetical protein
MFCQRACGGAGLAAAISLSIIVPHGRVMLDREHDGVRIRPVGIGLTVREQLGRAKAGVGAGQGQKAKEGEAEAGPIAF